MKDFNLDNIKEKTYTKIGCSNFIKEDIKRTRTKKVVVNTLITLLFISAGLFTVNAATDNALVNMIKQIAKMNGKDYEVIIHDIPVKIKEETDDGEIIINTYSSCIRIQNPAYPNDPTRYNEQCYPNGTKFKDIELIYNEKGREIGYHITGTDENGEYFEHNWDIKDDEKIIAEWKAQGKYTE